MVYTLGRPIMLFNHRPTISVVPSTVQYTVFHTIRVRSFPILVSLRRLHP
jgi:hypothetical protein